jgi:glutamate/tyrosine decarboxylase-like PLP-dependent enzyme
MQAYRDRAVGIKHPEIVAPVTAHPAFAKAAHYFGMKVVPVPVDGNYRADATAAAAAITRNTVVMVGSAPAFPHGTIDPIEELSTLALERGVGFHADACLGGFVLPWAERLGYPVPAFDFRLPGVTSMSADTHKYGYAAKGTSVVMYRGRDLRRHQYFTATDWPGGLYFSPTLAGSRPGALSAACWAAMVSIGEQGYLDATARILETASVLRNGIAGIPELAVLGDPLFVIAFGSDTVDIYQVLQRMIERGWSLNGLHRPPALHLAVTLRHTQPGVADRFLADLRQAVNEVKAHPGAAGGAAPLYGMAATVPARAAVDELLERYIDLLYEV